MSESADQFKVKEGFGEWAEVQIAQANHLHESLLEQHSALYRWIMAARLSVNGGAAVAIVNSNSVPPEFSNTALLLFATGATLSIIAAEQDQKAVEDGIAPNLSFLGFWVKAKAIGSFDQTRMEEVIFEASQASSSRKSGKRTGFLSLAAFVLGVVIIALGKVDWPVLFNAVENYLTP